MPGNTQMQMRWQVAFRQHPVANMTDRIAAMHCLSDNENAGVSIPAYRASIPSP